MFSLTILGCNSAIPAFGRNPTCQVLQADDELFLIDCGEGAQAQMKRHKIKQSKINHVFISHLHGDHYFGLIGLISSMGLNKRKNDLYIYAPPQLQAIIEIQLKAADTMLPFALHFTPIENNTVLLETNKITVTCFTVTHRIPCYGFVFKQKKNPRKINGEKINAYDIPAAFYNQLQAGSDYTTKDNKIIKNEWVTDEASKPKSYAYCADTIFDITIVEKINHVDLLYHETTYLKNDEIKAAERFHSTTTQAATIAKMAGAKQLIIGHFSSKYEVLDEFLIEAKEVFENTVLAIEGTCYLA